MRHGHVDSSPGVLGSLYHPSGHDDVSEKLEMLTVDETGRVAVDWRVFGALAQRAAVSWRTASTRTTRLTISTRDDGRDVGGEGRL